MEGPSKRLAVLQSHLSSGNSYSCKSDAGQMAGGGGGGNMYPKNLQPSAPMSSTKDEIQRAFPKIRQEILKWNGWGYSDSGFSLNENGKAVFLGKRYVVSGTIMPEFIPWLAKNCGFDPTLTTFSQPAPDMAAIPPPTPCPSFLEAVQHYCSSSDEAMDRLIRSHGHTCHELFNMRMSKFGRLPDIVLWPRSHDDVEKIVAAACKHDVCLVPFGGGTNVSGALIIPPEEKRVVVSLDLSEMDQILWIDEENLTAHVQAGVIGQDLERMLGERGYTTGHEPDSLEFSSIGGWVATRSSGMKKNIYGNIEDLIVRVRMVTPQGNMERNFLSPRNSIGPDIHHFMLGSEGIFGVITEVTICIRPSPEVRKYGSVVFPQFKEGVAFMREVAKQRCAPASIRLMDNMQFQLGQAMKPAATFTKAFVDSIKKLYLTRFKGFKVDNIAACTLLFEGSAAEVALQERKIYEVSSKFGGAVEDYIECVFSAGGSPSMGIPGGEENGHRGYLFTFVIAYIRDFAFDYSFLAESFETSVPWNRVYDLCQNVKDRIKVQSQKHGLGDQPLISYRVTQTYDSGACVYFYLAFNYSGISNPMEAFDEIEASARDEILANGGSLSHHHGVGKIRKKWLEVSLSPTGVQALKAIKESIDPNNIFGIRNLLP